MKVIARDERGNEFEKTVFLRLLSSGKISVLFGGPIEYYLSDLMARYPYERPMCIDIQGLNHKGSPVTITAEAINKVLEFCAIKAWMFKV